jgi:hypothetical protein
VTGPRTQEAAYLRMILEELQAIRKLLEGVAAVKPLPGGVTVTEAMPAKAPAKRTPRKHKATQE